MDTYYDNSRPPLDDSIDSNYQMTVQPSSAQKATMKIHSRFSTLDNKSPKIKDISITEPTSALKIKRLDQEKLQTRISLLENSKGETIQQVEPKEFVGEPQT